MGSMDEKLIERRDRDRQAATRRSARRQPRQHNGIGSQLTCKTTLRKQGAPDSTRRVRVFDLGYSFLSPERLPESWASTPCQRVKPVRVGLLDYAKLLPKLGAGIFPPHPHHEPQQPTN
jgi:hypothetical protein